MSQCLGHRWEACACTCIRTCVCNPAVVSTKFGVFQDLKHPATQVARMLTSVNTTASQWVTITVKSLTDLRVPLTTSPGLLVAASPGQCHNCTSHCHCHNGIQAWDPTYPDQLCMLRSASTKHQDLRQTDDIAALYLEPMNHKQGKTTCTEGTAAARSRVRVSTAVEQ